MPNFIITPDMGLANAIPGQDPGPDYATNNFNNMNIIDGHNHSAGSGVPINPGGLDINSDLSINNNNLTFVKTVNFGALLSPLAGVAPNLGAVYVAGNELYYNDEVGNVVQITNSGSVNAGAGSITGLPSGTASASYSAGPGTFIWQSATNTAANMDNASITIREQVANANGITISSPSALAADYNLVLFPTLPPSRKFVTVDNSGNMGDVVDVDNSTLEISSNTIRVKDLGITDAKIANATITPDKLSGFLNFQTFTTNGSFVVPSGITYVRVLGCGGGGGGAGGQNGPGAGGGGGGGAGIFEGVLNVVPGETLTIVIGTGGIGSANSGSPATGGRGGTSSITGSSSGLLVNMYGGLGGGFYALGSGGPPSSGTHYGGYGTISSPGAGYLDNNGNASNWNGSQAFLLGQGGFNSGATAACGGGSIGVGGTRGSSPTAGGIGAGGGGLDAGFNGSGGNGGNGQITIYVP